MERLQSTEEKNLIQTVTSKNYRGREYPRFWLTESGVLLALCEGVKQKTLIERTLDIYPEKKDLLFLLETIPILGKNAFDVAYLAVLREGKLQESDVIAVCGAQLQTKLSPEEIKQLSATLKKYPKQHQRCKDYIKLVRENLKNLDTQF